MNEFLKLRQEKFQRGPDSDRERRQETSQETMKWPFKILSTLIQKNVCWIDSLISKIKSNGSPHIYWVSYIYLWIVSNWIQFPLNWLIKKNYIYQNNYLKHYSGEIHETFKNGLKLYTKNRKRFNSILRLTQTFKIFKMATTYLYQTIQTWKLLVENMKRCLFMSFVFPPTRIFCHHVEIFEITLTQKSLYLTRIFVSQY